MKLCQTLAPTMARRHAQRLPSSFRHSIGQRNRRRARGLPHGTQAEHHNVTRSRLTALTKNTQDLQTERTSRRKQPALFKRAVDTNATQPNIADRATRELKASLTSHKPHKHSICDTAALPRGVRPPSVAAAPPVASAAAHCMGPHTRSLGPHSPAQVACPPFSTRHAP